MTYSFQTIAAAMGLQPYDEKTDTKTLAEEATEIIYGDREKTHGEPGKNLETIAAMWTAITGTQITPAKVCQMMIALKLARSTNDESHRDHWLDIVGYALLAERCGHIQSLNRRETNETDQDDH